MSNKNSVKINVTKTPDPKASESKARKFLWPYGVMIALVVVVAALLIYLAIQTYSPIQTIKELQGDQAPSTAGSGGNSATGPGSGSATDPATGAAADEMIATANGVPISKRNFIDMLTMSQNQRLSSGQIEAGEEPSMDLKLEVLNSLITMSIAVSAAYDLGYGPSELEVESAINQMVGEYGSREAFENALPAFGTDMATLRKQVADNLAVRAWRDTAFIKDALATDEELRKFYDEHLQEATHDDQVRAVRIMLPVPLTSGQEDPQAKAVVKAKADAIYQEALAGANFDELVERYMDPTIRSATQGGQMGWVTKGSLNFSELEKVLFSLAPGEVSEPVEDQFSYHIVKVIETRPAGVMSLEELKPEVMEYLLSVKSEELFLKALLERRQTAEVTIADPDIAEAWPAFMARISARPLPTSSVEGASSEAPAAESADPPPAPDPAEAE
jgi:parvulin-like peptidyl-prolyl isomerase